MLEGIDRVRTALAPRYLVQEELGRGGMAVVYLAEEPKHRRKVAVKVLRPEIAGAVGPDRFLREIRIAAGLTHPNVLPLHDSGEADGLLFYVMPFVDGESLRDRLRRERTLAVDEAVRIADEVADALAYAHEHGVIHRDIKPENVLLEAGHAVVTDFGIARAVAPTSDDRLTETGLAIGTPYYMSPEQASADTELDARSDIYSLGAVLYEMLGGEPPHTGPTPAAVLARVLTEEAPPLARSRAGLPPGLDGVVRRALAVKPADRFATATDFKQALRGVSPVANITPTPRPSRRMLAVGLVVVTLAAGWLLWPRAEAAPTDGRVGVAVFPFQATATGAAEWTEQLPDLLATVLDGTPGVRIADPWSLWSGLRPGRGARAESPADFAQATRLAREAQTERIVLGTVGYDGSALRVTARLYRAGEAEPIRVIGLSSSPDSIGTLVSRLAVDLVGRLQADEPLQYEPRATGSIGALKAYLAAREAMRRGEVGAAERSIDSAIALDSAFALGLIEALRIKTWARYLDGGQYAFFPLVGRARRHADSLSERGRLRLSALEASVRTDGPAAARAVRGILRIDSTDLEAWNLLAYLHRVYGWQYGSTEQDTHDALTRVLHLDSANVPGLVGLVSLEHERDNRANPDHLRLLRSADTAGPIVQATLQADLVLSTPDTAFDVLADSLVRFHAAHLELVVRKVRGGRPDRATGLVDRLRRRVGPGLPDYRAQWGRFLAAQGQMARLDSAVAAGAFPMQAVPRWYQVGPLLAGIGDSTGVRAVIDFLHEFTPPDSAVAWFETMPVWINGWTVGAFHATYGDTTITRQWHTTIGTLPGGGTMDYRGAIQSDLEARLLARRGDVDGALAAAARAFDLWAIHTENYPEFHPEPASRFNYGMLLVATGSPDSGAAVLRSLVAPTTWMGYISASAALELGRLAEAQGNRDDAARYYGIAYRLWRTADPELDPWKNAAGEGLERTAGEPVR